MGKIRTAGLVTLEFDPDLYEITIEVKAENKTSGAAISAGKKQTENLLRFLVDKLQIKPDQISAEDEKVSVPYQKDYYRFSRELLLTIPADNKLREGITNLIAEMDNVSYSISARLIDEREQRQMAVDAAVQCAKEKAEQAAAAMNRKVVDFEEICTDGIRPSGEKTRSLAKALSVETDDLAAHLKNPKIQISGEVQVIWLTEPLT